MAAVTPNYSLPYQELADPPDGPSLGKNLATAVDTELRRIDIGLTTGMVVFTQSAAGSGNFVKPSAPAARYHRVRLWGPGAAGGGVVAAGAGQGEGGGGGSGAFVERWYLDSELSASEAWVVGAGGTGVAGVSGNPGAAASTFKALSAGPGGGGTFMLAGTTDTGSNQGNGGTAAGGHTNCNGGDGGKGRRQGSFVYLYNQGAACPNGGGQATFPNFGSGAGTAGKSPGGGGSGAYGSTVGQPGGAGSAGKIEIVSFY